VVAPIVGQYRTLTILNQC